MACEYYIGLMSGTSIDGIDAVLVQINEHKMQLVAQLALKWPTMTQNLLHSLCHKDQKNELEKAFEARLAIAHREAYAVEQLLKKANLQASDIIAIGSHGQTVRHMPHRHYSVQLDSGPYLANLSNIDTIFDFRMADLACDGQGAPLTPIFHQLLLGNEHKTTFILNLGGIANLTILENKELICGFDCGPANTLIDAMCKELFDCAYDKNGEIAKQGQINTIFFNDLCSYFADYLNKDYPKSTGRELFNIDAILNLLNNKINKYDIITTLSYFSCYCAVKDIKNYLKTKHPYNDNDNNTNEHNFELILCGGGAHNQYISTCFERELQQEKVKVLTSSHYNISEDFFEAQAFAYFAYLFVHGQNLDLKTITGAQKNSILGCLAPAANGYYSQIMRNYKSTNN